jgi:CBS domain containing-hemolysin-like protein
MNSIIFLFSLLLILLFVTAMMSAAETAFFSLKPIDKDFLKKSNDKGYVIAKKLIDTPKDLLSIILIVINFSNIAIVLTVSSILGNYIDEEKQKTLYFVLDVIVSTFVILLVGEVIPKIYASKNNIKTVRILARPLNLINSIPPISWLRAGLVGWSEIIGSYSKKKGVKISSDELEQAIALTKEENTSEEEHKNTNSCKNCFNNCIATIRFPFFKSIHCK